MQLTPEPFSLHIADDAIADLRDRLARTRLPDEPPGAPWSTGTELGFVRDLVAYWRDGFDWRTQEARLNSFPQFRVKLHDIDLHFLHVPGRGPNPMPLLLSHGWPGSVFEFLDFIPRLTDPARFGGDPADSFTVVAPSLPGYGLSFRPSQRRFGANDIADCFADLMTDVLGYRRFGAQGGDWGATISTRLGTVHADKIIGLHLNMLLIRPDTEPGPDATGEAASYAAEMAAWFKDEAGYAAIQGTKPQTLAYALTDSPTGLAAWIAEKFHRWTDHGGDPATAVSRDDMLADIALYWFTGAIGSSFWPYYARMHGQALWPPRGTTDVPVGYAEFPRELRHPPRALAQRTYTDIRRWTKMPRGGHFAALEQPALLAEDVAAFFRPLRD